MNKKTMIIAAIIACLIIVAIIFLVTGESPSNSNEGKVVLDETMVAFIEDGFEDDGVYDPRLNPNGQRAITRANRTITDYEHEHNVDIDYEFVDYEMGEYRKLDEYNYVVSMTFKGRNSAGEYSYFETDVYFFCVEADTVGGFDLQVYCEGLEEYVKDLA